MAKIIITGMAGFIGFHLAKKLAQLGHTILGIDNLSDYYDVSLKEARLAALKPFSNLTFQRMGLEDSVALNTAFADFQPDYVVNLAAQAGVRYSLINPKAYVDSNLVGFGNILENCRHHNVKHLVYASSSSVYGANTKTPFSTTDNVDHPLSLYAATKKANELMAHTYANLFNIPTTGLRFFTVYGTYGRPDMALFSFTKAILEGKPIDVFNHGKMQRDFTHVDDIVESISRIIPKPATPNTNWDGKSPDPSSSFAPYKIYNIGNNNPVPLMDMIEMLEEALGIKAIKNMLPIQAGDVPTTYADIDALARDFDYRPKTQLKDGITEFVAWYKDYYKQDI